MSRMGKVFLVGAGPGDPGLITVRGLECLKQADLVLYDGLVNPLLLRHASGQVERTARTARCDTNFVPQADVNDRMIAAARSGKCVVRLKGGDPYIFGRGGEEAEALAKAGVSFEVVPGLTAATAAAVAAGISLTHREYASAVALVTGHEDPSRDESRLDYSLLARFPGTLVFYMGLHRIETIAEKLMASGLAATTPAAVVCQATSPRQQLVSGTVVDIAAAVRAAGMHPPSLIFIGEAAAHRPSSTTVVKRPLEGVSIGLTRADAQLDATIHDVVEQGGEPVLMPLIEILPPVDWTPIDAALERLDEFDWLVFTSANGVRSLLNRLWETGGDARQLARTRIASIGPATTEALVEFRLRADLIPEAFRAEELAAALAPHVRGRRVLWARANRGRDVLPEAMAAAGARLEQLVVYRNQDVDSLPADVSERIREGRLDWIALGSPSIARNLARLVSPDELRRSGSPRLAAISPVTAEAARTCGYDVARVATEFTWPGLLTAIAGAYSPAIEK